MSAVTNLPSHYKTLFADNWGVQAGQMTERLKDKVMVESSMEGTKKRYDDLDQGTLPTAKTTRAGATNVEDLSSSSRWLSCSEFEKAHRIDEYDDEKLGSLGKPDSEILRVMFGAFARRADKTIIEALEGTVYGGEQGTNPFTLPDAQKVLVAYDNAGGSTPLGLTLEKLIAVKSKFGVNEVVGQGITGGPTEKIYMAVSQLDLDNLLRINQVTSMDYNTIRALVAGEINTFMGIEFVRTEQLTVASSKRNCLAWVKSAVQFYAGQTRTYLNELPESSNARQIRVTSRIGAMRRYDNRVVLCETKAS